MVMDRFGTDLQKKFEGNEKEISKEAGSSAGTQTCRFLLQYLKNSKLCFVLFV